MTDIELRPNEASLEWLVRIVPDEWEAIKDGYMLTLQSDDRRVVVDPLNEQASFDERVRTGVDGMRWQQQELVKGQWYLQTTAGLLLWDINEDTDTEDTGEAEINGKVGQYNRVERESKGESHDAREY